MLDSGEVKRRQNEERLLKIQYAARVHYNKALRELGCGWILCILTLAFSLMPDSLPYWILNGIPFLLDLAVWAVIRSVGENVRKASGLREYFDDYVLQLPSKSARTQVEDINELSERLYQKNKEQARIQIAHNAHDNPPGVRDWYEITDQQIGEELQLECQKQNVWWNSKLTKCRICITACIAVVVIMIFLTLCLECGVIRTIICSAGLLVQIADRMCENIKYLRISSEIDGALKVVEIQPTETAVAELQDLINKRRGIVVLELDAVHGKNAGKWSNVYAKRKGGI